MPQLLVVGVKLPVPLVEQFDLLNAEEQSQAILWNSKHATLWRAGISLAAMTSFEVMLSVQGRTDDQVTEKVDVFSFGICLWEIWTLGEQVAISAHVLHMCPILADTIFPTPWNPQLGKEFLCVTILMATCEPQL